MKKAFEIRSIDVCIDGKHYYTPIPQNAKWFYDMWTDCGLECIGMKQFSDEWWDIRLKGKKKDIQKFVYIFSIKASTRYALSETIW